MSANTTNDNFEKIVFVGVLNALESLSEIDDTKGSSPQIIPQPTENRLFFSVEESLWGNIGSEIILLSPSSVAACVWIGSVGDRVVIHAYRDSNRKEEFFKTDVCQPNSSNPLTIQNQAKFLTSLAKNKTGSFKFYNNLSEENSSTGAGSSLVYTLIMGSLNGHFYATNRNGQLITKGNYIDGQRDGSWMHGYPIYHAMIASYLIFQDSFHKDSLIRRDVLEVEQDQLPYEEIGSPPYLVNVVGTFSRLCDGLGCFGSQKG